MSKSFMKTLHGTLLATERGAQPWGRGGTSEGETELAQWSGQYGAFAASQTSHLFFYFLLCFLITFFYYFQVYKTT